ncbi:MAG: diaminopimelate epimerase [Nitrospiraceae bacterium]|nr:MAG: diaminopimelate epimerase [Nitrospiraceae bacterium]
MELKFTKMHALGNDFVVIDNRDGGVKRIARLAQRLCNRRFGIGADQLLLLCHSKKADFRMRIFNADGSEVEMCGNGIRCLARYIMDDILLCDESSYAKKYCQTLDILSVETLGGIKEIRSAGNLFRVDMGEPVLEPDRIPVLIKAQGKHKRDAMGTPGSGVIINYPLSVHNKKIRVTCVSMGNPHAVIVTEDVNAVDLVRTGPLIENNPLFPKRTNVEFIQVLDRETIKMRVWERGAGETMACGTGASAAAVAASLLGLTGRKVKVLLPGGRLLISWSEKDNHVLMTGPAEKVFKGTIEI